MILLGIGLAILFYSLVDFKRAYFMYLLCQIFWFYHIRLIAIKGLPVITIGMAMSLWFVTILLLKKGRMFKYEIKMPYTLPLILIILSMFITCFFAVAGFKSEFSRFISLSIQNYSNIWVTWYLVETEEDSRFLLKGFIIVFFAACIFAFLEYVIKYNPYVAYKSSLTEKGIETYALSSGRGYRIMSVFEHPIGTGMTMGLYCVSSFLIFIRQKEKLPFEKLALLTAILCLPCIILTKMRASLFFTLVAAFSCIELKKQRFYKILLLILICSIFALPIIVENANIFLSMFSKSAQKIAKGSSVEMRLRQLKAVFELMKMSPLGGLGERFSDLISNEYTAAALDYESLWFEQMAKHGMVGVIAHIILIVFEVIIIPRKYRSKEIFFISLAYWATYTLTSVPSFRTHYYYFVLFYFIKRTKKYHRRYLEIIKFREKKVA